MKTEGFVKLLRKVIREEVSKAIKTELKPLLNEVNGVNKNTKLTNIASKPVTKKKYTKNPVLNDLLNETAAEPSTGYDTINYSSEMAQAFGMERTTAVAPTTGINGEAINMNNEAVATTVNAMTKDYSALMKAIDKKKGIR